MLNNKNNKTEGKLFVVSASSGAGKTSLINEVIKKLKHDLDISKITTYTTRSPRNNEENGNHYFFVSEKKFEQLKNDNFFLETTKYNGQLYGSPQTILNNLDLGKSFIIITDIDGAKEVKKLERDATLIWINAPSIKELKRRLQKRNSCTEKQIEERIKLAELEMKEVEKTRLFEFIVVNEVFDQTATEIALIITKKIKEQT